MLTLKGRSQPCSYQREEKAAGSCSTDTLAMLDGAVEDEVVMQSDHHFGSLWLLCEKQAIAE